MAMDVDAVKIRKDWNGLQNAMVFSGLTELYIGQPLKATLVYCFHPFHSNGEPHLLCSDVQNKCWSLTGQCCLRFQTRIAPC